MPAPWRAARRAWRRAAARLGGRRFGTVVSSRVDAPLVALTFDDGPDPVTTPLVLDVLARHRAHGTFFLVGDAARRHPALVARIAAEGHAIGHHTLEHVSLPGLPPHEVRRQIEGGFAAIGGVCQHLFRPPWGHLDEATWRIARRGGHEVVAWSGHTFDWTAQDAATLVQRLNATLAPGAIVLLHDAPQGGDAPDAPRRELLHALDAVLGANGRRWRFVALPELLAAGRPVREVRWRSRLSGDDR